MKMTVMKVTEVKDKLGRVVGYSTIFRSLEVPPAEISSCGNLSLFSKTQLPPWAVGQELEVSVT